MFANVGFFKECVADLQIADFERWDDLVQFVDPIVE